MASTNDDSTPALLRTTGPGRMVWRPPGIVSREVQQLASWGTSGVVISWIAVETMATGMSFEEAREKFETEPESVPFGQPAETDGQGGEP